MAQGFEEKDGSTGKEASKEADEKVSRLLADCRAFVTYVPLRGEVPFRDYVSLPEGGVQYSIAPRASLDPLQEAQNAMRAAGGAQTAILIPGRAFDASGTRHGRGGGWYDRFLAHVPEEWKRIGFCFERQFSPTPLRRESWDQGMDAICVVRGAALSVYETETR